MKKIDQYISIKQKNKYVLSRYIQTILMEFALDAYKIDNSISVSDYYKKYVEYLRKKWRESDDKKIFFKNEIIEV